MATTGYGTLAPALAVQFARAHDDFEVLADGDDALVDHAPVEFDLRLAGAAEEAVAAALALQVGPGPHEAALLVRQMRQLDLQPAFLGARAAAEDLEDQAGAVEHLGVPGALQVALLDWRHGMVDDDERRCRAPRSAPSAPRPCRCRTASPGAASPPAPAGCRRRRGRSPRQGRSLPAADLAESAAAPYAPGRLTARRWVAPAASGRERARVRARCRGAARRRLLALALCQRVRRSLPPEVRPRSFRSP